MEVARKANNEMFRHWNFSAFLPGADRLIKEGKYAALQVLSGYPAKASAKVEFFYSNYKRFIKKVALPVL